MPNKTLYIWDLADTLFGEQWNKEKSGTTSFDSYLESLGYDLKTISPKDYEWSYKEPFEQELLGLSILPGFKETLSWTKNNAVFTTGNKEQIEWRAKKFMEKGLFDIRPYFQKIYSTFDFGNYNVKTQEMFAEIIKKESAGNWGKIVYSDNKKENCEMFLNVEQAIPMRCYYINKLANGTTKISSNFFETPDLFSLLKNEQIN